MVNQIRLTESYILGSNPLFSTLDYKISIFYRVVFTIFENYIEEESKKDFIKEISYASEGNSNEKVKVKVKILRAYGGCLGDIC